MTRLIIAEKPSLGRAIAAVLPKPHKNNQGYIEAGDGSLVTWCVGHLLEQAPPEAYDERYKKWLLTQLPIQVAQWQLVPRKGMNQQITVIRRLLKSATTIIHAGDPDREGQLLVDELLDYLKLNRTRTKSVQRLLINDLNPSAVKQALNQLRSNQEFMALSVSALARSRADWLYGMNLSRAYTLLGQQSGYQGVLSVGRVQTPVLGLVVRRDQQIRDFIAKPFYQLDAIIPHDDKLIRARWQPSEACQQWLDEDKRVLSYGLAQHVQAQITDQPALVVACEHQRSQQAAPLPYSLSALQIDAAKRFGMTAQQVLNAAQSLYEQHKLITYPRSDCRYLPVAHHSQAPTIFAAIARHNEEFVSYIAQADPNLKSKCWNDSKVGAHHGVIPTSVLSSKSTLNPHEQKVYQLVSRQYLMQFFPNAQYTQNKLKFKIKEGLFIASGKWLIEAGWKVLVQQEKVKESNEAVYVPTLAEGSQLQCSGGEVKHCMTEPPKTFTEATLLQAMTGVARFVQNSALKSILKDTDGLGTEATRAGIIELLFKRGFLQRTGKSIRATATGEALINALPETVTYPDMTAEWERQLKLMAEKQHSYRDFMADITARVAQFIEQVQAAPAPQGFAMLASNSPPKRRNSSNTQSAARRARKRPRTVKKTE